MNELWILPTRRFIGLNPSKDSSCKWEITIPYICCWFRLFYGLTARWTTCCSIRYLSAWIPQKTFSVSEKLSYLHRWLFCGLTASWTTCCSNSSSIRYLSAWIPQKTHFVSENLRRWFCCGLTASLSWITYHFIYSFSAWIPQTTHSACTGTSLLRRWLFGGPMVEWRNWTLKSVKSQTLSIPSQVSQVLVACLDIICRKRGADRNLHGSLARLRNLRNLIPWERSSGSAAARLYVAISHASGTSIIWNFIYMYN